ncbi:MAG: PQQ-binding-like beta-propeller repeat protein [Phycisphaerales bacterium]
MRASLLIALAASPALGQEWTHYAATPERRGIASVPALPDLSSAAWTFDADGEFESVGQSGPVISEDGVVVVLGWTGPDAFAFALDASDGRELWRTPIAPPEFLSWASPAVQGTIDDGLVAVASGFGIVGLDLADGSEIWSVDLGQRMVNASPAIVGDPARVIVTTYAPAGGGRLVSIDAVSGDVLGDEAFGPTSGATPAVADGRVLVGDIDGVMYAFDFALDSLWTIDAPLEEGFFGGPSIVDGAAYAPTYGFFGGRSNSIMAKYDAATGDELWTTACERTDAVPIVLDDGRIVLSGGIDGFGSLATVQLFDASGTMLWDLVTETWDDLNGNGEVDPGEYLSYGGWDHQPAVLDTPDGPALLVGGRGGGLALLDLNADPAGSEFVIDRTTLGGGAPAVSSGVAVSAWIDGVLAFAYHDACFADFDGDGELTIFDFLAFQNAFDRGDVLADCDGDGTLTLFDFLCFQNAFDAGCG